MKMLLLLILVFKTAQAQTVSCQPHGASDFSNLEILKPDYNFEVPWYVARLTNKYRQRQTFIVKPTSRKDKLLFVTNDRREFALDFGSYKGLGMYHGAELKVAMGTSREATANLMCNFIEDVPFKNICQEKQAADLLFQAAAHRDLDLLESALACEVDANAKNKNGCSPLLLVADPSCGLKSVPYNSSLKAVSLVDALTNSGATLEDSDPLTGERALHKFVKFGDFDSVDLLLSLEADVNAQDKFGSTVLMRAVENNDKFMVQRILEANPDLDIKNTKGKTALQIAKDLNFKKLEVFLEKPEKTIEIHGMENGMCHAGKIRIPVGKVTRFVLQASEDDMFLLTAAEIGLNLMANAGENASQNVIPNRKGEVEFTCGIHGGSTQTTGKIIIE